jgi:hypothetical protein
MDATLSGMESPIIMETRQVRTACPRNKMQRCRQYAMTVYPRVQTLPPDLVPCALLQDTHLKMDDDLEKCAIEVLPVVSSVRFQEARRKKPAGYRFGRGCNTQTTTHISSRKRISTSGQRELASMRSG